MNPNCITCRKLQKIVHASRMPISEPLLPPTITYCGRYAQDFLVSNLFLVASLTFRAHYDYNHLEYCTHERSAWNVRNDARNFVQS